jgi:hypothetical protein
MSFSGLKTAALNLIHHAQQVGEELNIPDLCASFSAAVSDTLVPRVTAALEQTGYHKLAVAGGEVDLVFDGFPTEVGGDISDHVIPDFPLQGATRAEGISGSVGCDHEPGLIPQGMPLGQRLGIGHFQTHTPEMAPVQQVQQSFLVDQTAPAAVDQNRVLFHAAQPLPVQKTDGFAGMGQSAENQVRFRQQLIQLGKLENGRKKAACPDLNRLLFAPTTDMLLASCSQQGGR